MGIGIEAYNRHILEKIFSHPDKAFFKKLCRRIGIEGSNKLFDEAKRLADNKLDKGANIFKTIDHKEFTASIDIEGTRDDFPLDLVFITPNKGLFVIEMNCLKETYKELNKMFSKYTPTSFDIYEGHRLAYRRYDWKDCTTALDTI